MNAVKRLACLSERAPHPLRASGTRRLPNPHWRRIGHGGEFAPPDGGRWWQMLGLGAKLRHKEAAGNCRAAHSQNRGGGGPRGGPLVVTRSCGGPRSRHSKAAEPAPI